MNKLFERYNWLKTFLLSALIGFIILLALFNFMDAFSSDSKGTLIATFVISILLGAIYTYFRHFSKKDGGNYEEKKKQEKISAAKEFQNQIENYDKLKITKSKRGEAALLMTGFMIVTIILALSNVISMDSLYGLIVYIPLIYFVYRGNRWAIIGAMIIWTFDKGYQFSLQNNSSPMPIIIWWLILIVPLYQALKIENERLRIRESNNIASNTKIVKEEATIGRNIFCSNCGQEASNNPNFCKNCGIKLT